MLVQLQTAFDLYGSLVISGYKLVELFETNTVTFYIFLRLKDTRFQSYDILCSLFAYKLVEVFVVTAVLQWLEP